MESLLRGMMKKGKRTHVKKVSKMSNVFKNHP